MQEELLLVTAAKHPLSRKRKILPQDLVRQPFVLFESRLELAAGRRRVLHDLAHRAADCHGDRERRDHQGDGPQRHRHHASSRSRRSRATSSSGQLFCARIEGRSLVRETGWVYPKMSRTPRTVQEVIRAFERVRPKLRLTP